MSGTSTWGRIRTYRQDRRNGRPPWWVWFEPPRCWPKWLHLLTCTYCHGWNRYFREQKKLGKRRVSA